MVLRLYKDFSNFKHKNRNRPKVSHNSNGVWPQCGYNTNDLRCLSFYAKSRTCSFIDKYLRFLLFAKVNDIAFFRHFPKAWIDTFYCVCCIQYFSYCTSIIKHLGYMLPVSHPDIYSSRILAACKICCPYVITFIFVHIRIQFFRICKILIGSDPNVCISFFFYRSNALVG